MTNQHVNHLSVWMLLAVAAVLLLAAGLRFARIDYQSLWYDEGVSAAAAVSSPAEIIEGAAHDIHPPGYYLLLAGWVKLAGHSEFALRGLSALLGVLAVAVVYALGNRFFDRATGILAALLVAVNPFQVYYGQETRMYALLALLSALSVLLTAAVLSIPGEMVAGRFRARRAGLIVLGYIVVNAAGLYTHYTFPFVILAESLVFLLWMLRRDRKLHGVVVWVGLQLGTLLLYAPWAAPAIRQLTSYPQVAPQDVSLVQVAGTIAYGINTPLPIMIGGIIPFVLLALVGLFPPLDDRITLRFSERAGLLLAWLVVPVIIPLAMGVIREPFLRFFISCGLAFMLLAARGFVVGLQLGIPGPGGSSLNAFFTQAVVVILAIAGVSPMVTGLRNLYFDPAYWRDDYRGVANDILAESGPDVPVVLTAHGQQQVFGYYFPGGTNVTPLPDDNTPATLARLLDSSPRIYAVYYGEDEQDPEGIVEGTLARDAFTVSSAWYGHVRLVTYAVPADPATEPEVISGAVFGDSIKLEGYALSGDVLAEGDALAVTLFWRSEFTPGGRYKVFVHLVAPDGSLAAQHDSEPNGDLSPTFGWQPGQRIADNHAMFIPAGAVPGYYQLMVGMYGYEDGVRLPILGDGDQSEDRLLLGTIEVAE